MLRKILFALLLLAGVSISLSAQDPVLFTVDGESVHVSEFEYIYSKSKIDTASYSRASLEEYLELYKNFKLKVKRAKDMKLDTIPALQRELAGYRKQLANSYLVDKEVTDKLIKEAYDRSLFDVSISHIMIKLEPNAAEKEVKIAEQKLMDVQKKLKNGESFEELAKTYSDDTNTKEIGGSMGYLNPIFPDGFYNLETAAFLTPVGEVSDIVRTVAGVHLIKVNEKRDAIGQMEVAHILIRNPKEGDPNSAKTKIDKIYQQLEGGEPFEKLAKELSEDGKTAPRGGYIGYIGVRHPFEASAFAITANDAYSTPFQSSVGWHIVKRINKKPVETFEIAKRRIQTRMQENQRKSKNPDYNRLTNARKTMIARIKRDGNYKENKSVLNSFIASLDSTFITYKWKAPKENPPKDVLFTLGDKNGLSASLYEFQDFCQRNSKRMRRGRNMNRKDLVNLLYDEFLDDNCIKYEETQLEEKYPDFKSLMREYEEGILLFEATKILVWDKASQDSVGLDQFFKSRENVYKWNERAVVSKYTVSADNAEMVPDLIKKVRRLSPDKYLEKINKGEEVVSREEKLYEKSKSKLPDGMEWELGSISEVSVNKRNKASSFYKLESMLPVSNKTLKDARGFVIADYQNYLEKQWIIELKKTYPIKVNEDVFNALIKK